jgi:hypothetical protein
VPSAEFLSLLLLCQPEPERGVCVVRFKVWALIAKRWVAVCFMLVI